MLRLALALAVLVSAALCAPYELSHGVRQPFSIQSTSEYFWYSLDAHDTRARTSFVLEADNGYATAWICDNHQTNVDDCIANKLASFVSGSWIDIDLTSTIARLGNPAYQVVVSGTAGAQCAITGTSVIPLQNNQVWDYNFDDDGSIYDAVTNPIRWFSVFSCEAETQALFSSLQGQTIYVSTTHGHPTAATAGVLTSTNGIVKITQVCLSIHMRCHNVFLVSSSPSEPGAVQVMNRVSTRTDRHRRADRPPSRSLSFFGDSTPDRHTPVHTDTHTSTDSVWVRPVLGDLGSGRVVPGGTGGEGVVRDGSAGSVHTFVGTPSYMAPEVLSGYGYGRPVDVFGIGCLLKEMCTRELPFGKGSAQQVMATIRSGTYSTAIPSMYPPSLHTLVAQCMAAKASHRPSIQDVYSVLSGIQADMERERERRSAEAEPAHILSARVPRESPTPSPRGSMVMDSTQTLPTPSASYPPDPDSTSTYGGDTVSRRSSVIPPRLTSERGRGRDDVVAVPSVRQSRVGRAPLTARHSPTRSVHLNTSEGRDGSMDHRDYRRGGRRAPLRQRPQSASASGPSRRGRESLDNQELGDKHVSHYMAAHFGVRAHMQSLSEHALSRETVSTGSDGVGDIGYQKVYHRAPLRSRVPSTEQEPTVTSVRPSSARSERDIASVRGRVEREDGSRGRRGWDAPSGGWAPTHAAQVGLDHPDPVITGKKHSPVRRVSRRRSVSSMGRPRVPEVDIGARLRGEEEESDGEGDLSHRAKVLRRRARPVSARIARPTPEPGPSTYKADAPSVRRFNSLFETWM
ncbi:hypothetical protein KIPB_005412 [Kipferlia bialata]|uniref:non-specific serine/threonine protein kinase n=1 Tax=Kipferlia bialata TaxID=797122 RepID=A0A9K3GIW7_9EUKA|nr:hypothetical protein KIPB_005412 [Kipferlia bialata]|eukprot:g5412.t1